jgi:hypothetical protein
VTGRSRAHYLRDCRCVLRANEVAPAARSPRSIEISAARRDPQNPGERWRLQLAEDADGSSSVDRHFIDGAGADLNMSVRDLIIGHQAVSLGPTRRGDYGQHRHNRDTKAIIAFRTGPRDK